MRNEIRRDPQVFFEAVKMIRGRLLLIVVDLSPQMLEGVKRSAELRQICDFFLGPGYKCRCWICIFGTIS